MVNKIRAYIYSIEFILVENTKPINVNAGIFVEKNVNGGTEIRPFH